MARMLYLVAGEQSGDTRGAELISALADLRPGWTFRGLGGPKMRGRVGEGMRDWVDQAAVVGLWEVLRHYRWFKARFEETLAEIEEVRPDAVVLIDYPGFNLRLARALRDRGLHARLIYYISPQVWAWNKGRVSFMAEWLDLMVCLFPFEQELFEQAGLKAVCMGHPMVDHLEEERSGAKRNSDLVGLFPGSREREVERLFPLMVRVVQRLQGLDLGWTFEASAATEPLHLLMKRILEDCEKEGESVPVRIVTGKSHELMQRARCGVVASGTATLEATYYGLPYCLVYKVAWPTYLAGRMLVDIEHLGMANILAGREIVHEFIQHEATVENVASFVESVMTDTVRREELQRNLLKTAALLGGGGAAEVGARAITDLLESDDN